MITPTWREPSCDVAAQLSAVRDPKHPKDAMWISTGTPRPDDLSELVVFECPAGILLTTEPRYAEWLRLSPTIETLAAILGYIEPKTQIIGVPAVVQARDRTGNVITEMACSPHRVADACCALSRHGAIRVLDLMSAIQRRAALCCREMSDGHV